MDKITNLIDRLHEAILKNNLSDRVSKVYYDQLEDIVTIILFYGVDKVEFYMSIESSGLLKKDDQVTINWL